MSEITSDKTRVGSSYLVNFYNNILDLTNNLAKFSNTLLEIESRSSNGELVINDGDKEVVKNSSHFIRYFVRQCHINYCVLCNVFNVKVNELEKGYYEEIKKTLIPKEETIELFTTCMHEFIAKEAVGEWIRTGQDIVNQLYNDAEK